MEHSDCWGSSSGDDDDHDGNATGGANAATTAFCVPISALVAAPAPQLLDDTERRDLWAVLWGGGSPAGPPAGSGWAGQGLVFAAGDDGSGRPAWGLVQRHGGPCGLLAALQAEVIAALLEAHGCARVGLGALLAPERACSQQEVQAALADALTTMLWRAACGGGDGCSGGGEQEAAAAAGEGQDGSSGNSGTGSTRRLRPAAIVATLAEAADGERLSAEQLPARLRVARAGSPARPREADLLFRGE